VKADDCLFFPFTTPITTHSEPQMGHIPSHLLQTGQAVNSKVQCKTTQTAKASSTRDTSTIPRPHRQDSRDGQVASNRQGGLLSSA
jgi:hypothetical protein